MLMPRAYLQRVFAVLGLEKPGARFREDAL
jgi:hypothetical protein